MADRAVWSWYVNRNRVSDPTLESTAPPKLDGPLEKLAKLFPLEVITVFTGADQFARAATGDLRLPLLWLVAIAGFLLVPGAFMRLRGISWSDGWAQIIIGLLAYVMWVYGQGTLSAELEIYEPLVAGVLVVVFLGIVVVYGPKQPD